jgi:hypothetical protein
MAPSSSPEVTIAMHFAATQTTKLDAARPMKHSEQLWLRLFFVVKRLTHSLLPLLFISFSPFSSSLFMHFPQQSSLLLGVTSSNTEFYLHFWSFLALSQVQNTLQSPIRPASSYAQTPKKGFLT